MSDTGGRRTKYRDAIDKLLGNPVCRRILDSSREGFLVADRAGRLLEVNAALCDGLGVAREKLLRISLAELPLDPVPTAEHLEEILKGDPTLFRNSAPGMGGKPVELRLEARYIAEFEVIVASVHFGAERGPATVPAEGYEKRFLKLIETAPVPIVVHAGETIRLVNSAAVKAMGGRGHGDLVGQPIWRFVHADSRPSVKGRVMSVYGKEEVPPLLEARLVGLDGRNIDVEISSLPIDYDGEAASQVVFRDVTEINRALRALRESERRYRELYESMPDGAAAVSLDGTIIDCNPAFEVITGYSRTELAELTYRDITPEKWHRMEDQIIEAQVLKRGYSNLYEKEYRRKDGTLIPVQLRTYRAGGGDGRPQGMWAIVRDMSDMHRTQRQLEETREALEREQDNLHNKNVALQELLHQIDLEKRRLGDTLQRNVSRLVEPMLATLAAHLDDVGREQLSTLHARLAEVLSPFVRSLEIRHPPLTPRQIEICSMVRNGLSSKEIASSLNISSQTVLTLRKVIRRKLGLTHDKTNLAAYLRSLEPPSATPGG